MTDNRNHEIDDIIAEVTEVTPCHMPSHLVPVDRINLRALVTELVDARNSAPAADHTEPSPDPDVVTWTPDQGPLADHLRDLPDSWPVTIRGDWGEQRARRLTTYDDDHNLKVSFPHSCAVYTSGDHGITSASWRRPAPAWDGALVIQDVNGAYWVRLANGNYATHGGGEPGVDAITLSHSISGVRVVIDADGHHVTEEQA